MNVRPDSEARAIVLSITGAIVLLTPGHAQLVAKHNYSRHRRHASERISR
jgi:hypothetical protein